MQNIYINKVLSKLRYYPRVDDSIGNDLQCTISIAFVDLEL